MQLNKIHNIDTVKGIKLLNDNSIDCIVTSPPYWQKRDYGTKEQWGLEESYQDYLNKLIDLFEIAKNKLKDTGSLWANIWDTYSGSGNAAGDKNDYLNKRNARSGKVPEVNVPKTSMIGIPMRFATMMIDNGWILKNTIIWQKPNATPGGGADKRKFTNDFEYFFWFVKTNKYYFNPQKEPLTNSTYLRAKSLNKSKKSKTGVYKGFTPAKTNKYYQKILKGEIDGRNKRTVWNIPTKSFHGAHFAVFPKDLIITPILSTCPERGVVLDPFMGSGTTAEVCIENNRNYIGFEINKEYINIANQRLNSLKGIESTPPKLVNNEAVWDNYFQHYSFIDYGNHRKTANLETITRFPISKKLYNEIKKQQIKHKSLIFFIDNNIYAIVGQYRNIVFELNKKQLTSFEKSQIKKSKLIEYTIQHNNNIKKHKAMTIKEALNILKGAIPLKIENAKDEIVSKAISLIEIKTRGFTYPDGISTEKIDVTPFLKENNMTLDEWLESGHTQKWSEEDSLIKWLVPEVQGNLTSNDDDFEMLELEAEAEAEAMLMLMLMEK